MNTFIYYFQILINVLHFRDFVIRTPISMIMFLLRVKILIVYVNKLQKLQKTTTKQSKEWKKKLFKKCMFVKCKCQIFYFLQFHSIFSVFFSIYFYLLRFKFIFVVKWNPSLVYLVSIENKISENRKIEVKYSITK